MTSSQRRICLWSNFRSLSSAFFHAMNNASGTKGIYEPYTDAYYFGTERISSRYSSEPPREDTSYMDIKALLEKPYEDNVVFVKDMAYALLSGPHPYLDMLPAGYQHTFLIRDPKKSIPSLYKISLSKEETGWDHFEPREAGFKELYQLYTIVTESLKQKTVILDADDILSHPEDMLQQYCELTGQEFHPEMLHWNEASPVMMDGFKDWPLGWFKTLLSSTTFSKPSGPSNPIDISKQPQLVQQVIKECQPYYEKLYNLRVMPRHG